MGHKVSGGGGQQVFKSSSFGSSGTSKTHKKQHKPVDTQAQPPYSAVKPTDISTILKSLGLMSADSANTGQSNTFGYG